METLIATAQSPTFVTYGVLQIIDRNVVGIEEDLSWSDNGLTMEDEGVVAIRCATHTGNVDVTVELHSGQPPLALDGWDEVVDVSLDAPNGHLRVVGLMSDPPEMLPVLSTAGPGWYRLRIQASGRDDSPPDAERFMVKVWSAPDADPIIHQAADTFGLRLRG